MAAVSIALVRIGPTLPARADAGLFPVAYPGSPTDWVPQPINDWDLLVHNRDTISTLPALQAHDGSNCSSYPATHAVSSYADAVYLCGGEVQTAIDGEGYGEIVMTPAQMVDFSSGATVQVDLSTLRSSSQDWVDLWLTRFDEQLVAPAEPTTLDLQGVPRDAIHVVEGGIPSTWSAYVINGFNGQFVPGTSRSVEDCVGNQVSATRLTTMQLSVAPNHLTLDALVDGTPCPLIDAAIPNPGFTQGVLQLAQHSYQPSQATTNFGGTAGPNTWHWANLSVSNPLPYTMLRGNMPMEGLRPGTTNEVDFQSAAPPDAHLRFAALAVPGSVQVSFFDGQAWSGWTPAAMQAQCGGSANGVCTGRPVAEHISNYWTAVPMGTVAVRFAATTPNDVPTDWNVTDVSIVAPPASAPVAPPPSPSPSPDGQSPSPGSTPSPTPTSPPAQTSFYFAEGFTGPGFQETLDLFMPNYSGTALIDFYTQNGHSQTRVSLVAGQVYPFNVNSLGQYLQVSAHVTLPAPGVVERKQTFSTGTWSGSSDKVGVPSPRSEWDFAEGSTLPFFSEYLSLQNPNPTAVTTDLDYVTDAGVHPDKTLVLPAMSRTTVEVFRGGGGDDSACSASAGTCGVGPGIQGVSVRVLARGGAQIVAERPMYVNGFDFGAGAIHDGDDVFGAAGPATDWSFAEGNTLTGFNEFLCLQNPSDTPAHVSLDYVTSTGQAITRQITIPPVTRGTVQVWATSSSGGIGPGLTGVSVHVSSDVGIVAERPMYVVHDFGQGPVSGADVVVGATETAQLFGFASASTLSGEYDFLTLGNTGPSGANVTITYYPGHVAGLWVGPHSRQTVQVFGDPTQDGDGRGLSQIGILVQSTAPILVEKPTYSIRGSGGATDTLGYSPASF